MAERSIGAMVLRLSRRAFSSFAIGSLFGCDDASRASSPAPPVLQASVEPRASASIEPVITKPASVPLPLFRAYPALASRISRMPLGQFPTPVERAEKLGALIGVPNLWFKRDDISGTEYGGGKTRKLEFYLGEARAKGARQIITFGGYGSNQAVATALWGRTHGFAVKLLLAPQLPNRYVEKNLLVMRKAGATIEVARDGVGAAEQRAKESIERSEGKGVYLIPPGGSSPLGNVAFVNAAMELAQQIQSGQCPMPDCIYLAMGTMGSAVGLAIGLELVGLRTEVVAVRASSAATSSEARFFAMVKETLAYARSLDPAFPTLRLDRRRIRFQTQQLGGGYGYPTRKGVAAMKLVEDAQGYSLEPTYTAKAMAALVAEAKRLEKMTVLFWNSHNTQLVESDGVGPNDFPRELRDYLLQHRSVSFFD